MTARGHFWRFVAPILLLLTNDNLRAAVGQHATGHQGVPLDADHWHAVADHDPAEPQFLHHEGFPNGVLLLKRGTVALAGASFRSGTIDFDMKPVGDDFSGVLFRSNGTGAKKQAEEFYIRNSDDCRASDDCVQYAPVLNGFMLWNVLPQFQSTAFVLPGWNHVQLRISEHRLAVFMNGQAKPSLSVNRLQGSTVAGAIELTGSAYFANVQIASGTPANLPDAPGPDPAKGDPRVIRNWTYSAVQPFHLGVTPTYAETRGVRDWRKIEAEDYGFIDLNRVFAASEQPAGLVWLRTRVVSTTQQSKHVSLGWIGQSWIFVNGTLVATGKNFYYPEEERRAPDGRLSLQNGSFDIPLGKGVNEIVIALFNSIRDKAAMTTRYGWGMKMSLSDSAGIQSSPAEP